MIPQMMQRITALEAVVQEQTKELALLNQNLQELRQQLQVDQPPQENKTVGVNQVPTSARRY